MFSQDQIANQAESVVRDFFKNEGVNVARFTPSIVSGRRYLGLVIEDESGLEQQFAVEINVKEV